MQKMMCDRESRKGGLVYIPSQTFLSDQLDVKRTSQLQKVIEPGIFLVVGESSGSYKILYKGKDWFVAKKDVYEIEENNDY